RTSFCSSRTPGCPSMLLLYPEDRLSRTRTSAPFEDNSLAIFEPIKPAPPVMSTFMSISEEQSLASHDAQKAKRSRYSLVSASNHNNPPVSVHEPSRHASWRVFLNLREPSSTTLLPQLQVPRESTHCLTYLLHIL